MANVSGDVTPHAKIQTDRPNESVQATTWFLAFYTFFRDHNFCSCPESDETKPHKCKNCSLYTLLTATDLKPQKSDMSCKERLQKLKLWLLEKEETDRT